MSGNTQREAYFGSEQGNQTCDAWVNAQPENFDLDKDGLGDYFIPSDDDEELVGSPLSKKVLFPYVNNPDIMFLPKTLSPVVEATPSTDILESGPTLMCLKRS